MLTKNLSIEQKKMEANKDYGNISIQMEILKWKRGLKREARKEKIRGYRDKAVGKLRSGVKSVAEKAALKFRLTGAKYEKTPIGYYIIYRWFDAGL